MTTDPKDDHEFQREMTMNRDDIRNKPTKGRGLYLGPYARAVDELDGLAPFRYRVLHAIATHVNEETGLCFPGEDTIARRAHADVSSVRRAIKWLEANGYLRRIKDTRGGRVVRTYYVFLFDPCVSSDEHVGGDRSVESLAPAMSAACSSKEPERPHAKSAAGSVKGTPRLPNTEYNTQDKSRYDSDSVRVSESGSAAVRVSNDGNSRWRDSCIRSVAGKDRDRTNWWAVDEDEIRYSTKRTASILNSALGAGGWAKAVYQAGDEGVRELFIVFRNEIRTGETVSNAAAAFTTRLKRELGVDFGLSMSDSMAMSA